MKKKSKLFWLWVVLDLVALALWFITGYDYPVFLVLMIVFCGLMIYSETA